MGAFGETAENLKKPQEKLKKTCNHQSFIAPAQEDSKVSTKPVSKQVSTQFDSSAGDGYHLGCRHSYAMVTPKPPLR